MARGRAQGTQPLFGLGVSVWISCLLLTACVDIPVRAVVSLGDAAVATDGRPTDDRPDADLPPEIFAPCDTCPPEAVCVDGQCAACDPETHLGCLTESTRPICDRETLVCVGCSSDSDCPGQYCVFDGRCAECNPTDGRGCGEPERPICDIEGVCRPCNVDGECRDAMRPAQCDDLGICRQCLDGIGRGCEPSGPTPICENERCRACAGNDECGPGLMCDGGRCLGCNPADNTGCDPDGETPICLQGACVPCQNNGQCLDPQRDMCVGGRCRACEPATHDGCDPASGRPLCADGQCVPCGNTDTPCDALDPERPLCLANGQCAGCDPAAGGSCDAGSTTPICDIETLTCVGCREHQDCPGHFCDPAAGGRCVACVAGTPTGCDAGSETPVCLPDPWRCGPCTIDDHCSQNRRGPVCNDSLCGCDNDDDCANTNRGLHCHGTGICGCHDDRECPGDRVCDGEKCVNP